MNKRKLSMIFLTIGLCVFIGAAIKSLTLAGSPPDPIPDDVKITPPAADLPKEIKAFSGKWRGTWKKFETPESKGQDTILVVEKIDSENATIFYCWGDEPDWWTSKGSRRMTGKILKDQKVTLQIPRGDGRYFDFFLNEGGDLVGATVTAGGIRIDIIMKRIP